jgi:hypothetical protein
MRVYATLARYACSEHEMFFVLEHHPEERIFRLLSEHPGPWVLPAVEVDGSGRPIKKPESRDMSSNPPPSSEGQARGSHMAKVNGFKLQQAIAEQIERRKLAEAQFEGCLRAFEGEKKPKPEVVIAEYQDAETKVATLQAAQDRYNLQVQVEVQGRTITLHEATKLVGGAKRVEQKWRTAATDGEDRYSRQTVRDRDSIVAQRQIDQDKAAELAKEAAKRVRALRFAIQKGNATEIDMSVDLGLD